MPAVRPWLVVPVLGLASAGVAFAVDRHVALALALGLCGAALAAAIRAFLGPSVVAAVAAVGGAAIGVLGALALHVAMRDAIAGAAALFAIGELARPKLPNDSPLPAVGAALLAGALDPSYAALVVVSGIVWLRSPVKQPRAAFVIPLVGAVATTLACIAAITASNNHAWHAWLGHATTHNDKIATLLRTGDLVGPLTAFASLVGLVMCFVHHRFASVAVVAVVTVTAIVSLACGFVAPAAPLVAALGAGVAIGRLASLVRWPVGQTFVGATVAFVLVVVPVLTLMA